MLAADGERSAGPAANRQPGMPLTVLSAAYPLAPVGPDAAGGAEQVLTAIDRALVRAGHRSIVVACEGSEVDGELVAWGSPGEVLDESACSDARGRCCEAILRVLRESPVDVVHLHGVDFTEYVPGGHVPVLVTLHLPRSFYSRDPIALTREYTWFH
jgi:hypothetical protein